MNKKINKEKHFFDSCSVDKRLLHVAIEVKSSNLLAGLSESVLWSSLIES